MLKRALNWLPIAFANEEILFMNEKRKQMKLTNTLPSSILRYYLCISFFLLYGFSLLAQDSFVNICKHGADNSGKINSSPIINRLIDSLNTHSGGTIFFPAGTYTCGPIFLKSNITLYTDAGATINFSDNFDDYLPMVTSQWEGVRVKTFASQIYAIDAVNISIKGEGHFEGHGKKWWDYWFKVSREGLTGSKWQQLFEEENKEMLLKNEYLPKMKSFLRPPMVLFYNCRNILIEGVSFSNPPFWTLVPVYSENITISKVTIDNPGNSPNTDGIDPCSCRNVRISDCHITVGDDCIVLKSGRDVDGREVARPTENVTITNCTMLNGHGGVVLGSEMSGDIRRVTISNCVFEGTDRGIRLKTMRGRGGVLENIRVSNIIMHNIIEEGIVMNMRYQTTLPEKISERTPTIKNIHLSNISISGAQKGIAIYGLEERSVDQLSFTDIDIHAEQGIWGQYAQNMIFDNIRIETQSDEPTYFDKCSDVSISGLQLLTKNNSSTSIKIDDCENFKIADCFQSDEIGTFLKFDDKCQKIYMLNNVLTGAKKILDGNDPKKIKQLNTIK
jgi:polygalacturonase